MEGVRWKEGGREGGGRKWNRWREVRDGKEGVGMWGMEWKG